MAGAVADEVVGSKLFRNVFMLLGACLTVELLNFLAGSTNMAADEFLRWD